MTNCGGIQFEMLHMSDQIANHIIDAKNAASSKATNLAAYLENLSAYFLKLSREYSSFCKAVRNETSADVKKTLEALRSQLQTLLGRTAMNSMRSSEFTASGKPSQNPYTFDAAKIIFDSKFDVYTRRGDTLSQVCRDLSHLFALIVVKMQKDLIEINKSLNDDSFDDNKVIVPTDEPPFLGEGQEALNNPNKPENSSEQSEQDQGTPPDETTDKSGNRSERNLVRDLFALPHAR